MARSKKSAKNRPTWVRWAARNADPSYRKITNLPGALRRKAYSTILDKVAALGLVTRNVAKMKPEDLHNNRAYSQHRQRVMSTIQKFTTVSPWQVKLPPKVEELALLVAFKSMEENR